MQTVRCFINRLLTAPWHESLHGNMNNIGNLRYPGYDPLDSLDLLDTYKPTWLTNKFHAHSTSANRMGISVRLEVFRA